MPTKTKRDEHKWQKAKDIAKEQGHAEDYAYIMGIYKKMKPDYEFKTEDGKPKKAVKDKIPGGLADKKKPSDFDPKAVAKGQKVEMEHTNDPALAREIARDHLTEDPDYYEKLEQMETGNCGKTAVSTGSIRYVFTDGDWSDKVDAYQGAVQWAERHGYKRMSPNGHFWEHPDKPGYLHMNVSSRDREAYVAISREHQKVHQGPWSKWKAEHVSTGADRVASRYVGRLGTA